MAVITGSCRAIGSWFAKGCPVRPHPALHRSAATKHRSPSLCANAGTASAHPAHVGVRGYEATLPRIPVAVLFVLVAKDETVGAHPALRGSAATKAPLPSHATPPQPRHPSPITWKRDRGEGPCHGAIAATPPAPPNSRHATAHNGPTPSHRHIPSFRHPAIAAGCTPICGHTRSHAVITGNCFFFAAIAAPVGRARWRYRKGPRRSPGCRRCPRGSRYGR